MTKYLLAYKGGGAPDDPEEQQKAMAAWGQWFESLGSAVSDPGNPFAASAAIGNDGAVYEGATSGLTGYSVVNADELSAATEMAKGCPVLASGGSVEVYETFEVM
jgi:hypothetical protein